MKAISSAFSEKGGYSAQFVSDGYTIDARKEILPDTIKENGVQVGEGVAWDLIQSFLKNCAARAAYPRLANMMIMSGAADLAAIIEEGAPHGITDVRDVRLTSRMKELARRWRRMVLPFRRECVAGACFCQTDGGTGAFGGSPV